MATIYIFILQNKKTYQIKELFGAEVDAISYL